MKKKKKNIWSAVSRPEEASDEFIGLAGQWNTPVDVELHVTHRISEGPICTRFFETSGKKKKRKLNLPEENY
ncbi:MAG: hypothetical protein E3K32_12455 [wastewater metagenome]|nr:hypothetical protein [Candidatus Loosdrechtia aerotolerans]